jgi:hypothetical protein
MLLPMLVDKQQKGARTTGDKIAGAPSLLLLMRDSE